MLAMFARSPLPVRMPISVAPTPAAVAPACCRTGVTRSDVADLVAEHRDELRLGVQVAMMPRVM